MIQESQAITVPKAHPNWENLSTYLIVAACSIFFCSKGVFIKSAYELGADPIAVLGLRMAYALPFFLLMAVWSSRGRSPLTLRHWLAMTWLGFVGYYLSAVVNFAGLQFISVGLERVVLYTYPSLVLLGSALFLGKRVPRRMVFAMLIAYLGIVIAFRGEAAGGGDSRSTLIGVGLVFTSAVTYAIFVIGSGKLIGEVGPTRFTSHVVGISCVFVLMHFAIQRSVDGSVAISPGVHSRAMAWRSLAPSSHPSSWGSG